LRASSFPDEEEDRTSALIPSVAPTMIPTTTTSRPITAQGLFAIVFVIGVSRG
jgi:hypothetical protein